MDPGPVDSEVEVDAVVEVEGGIDAAPASTSEAPVGDGGRYEGAALVDQRVRVLWSGDGPHAWYAGVVTRWQRRGNVHTVAYDDGDTKGHYLDNEAWAVEHSDDELLVVARSIPEHGAAVVP